MADDDSETTKGGGRILRYVERTDGWIAPAPSRDVETIEAHFSRYYGEPETVFHEIVSDLVHIDVHVVPPASGRDRWTLFTTGMSDLPMAAPAGAEDRAFAELVLFLPAEWRVDLLKMTPPPDDLERWYWPLRWLKYLAPIPSRAQDVARVRSFDT